MRSETKGPRATPSPTPGGESCSVHACAASVVASLPAPHSLLFRSVGQATRGFFPRNWSWVFSHPGHPALVKAAPGAFVTRGKCPLPGGQLWGPPGITGSA